MTYYSAVLLGIYAALPLGRTAEGEHYSVPRKREDPFYVAGYAVRTNNTDEMLGHGKIGKLWQSFGQQDLGSTISHRLDSSLIAVYSEYSSDEKGEFTYLLGARVSSIQDLPAEMTCSKVTPGLYAVFTTRPGPLVEVLQAEWKSIWAMTPNKLGGRRAFITDYEIYDQRSADPQKAQIEIHIGLKQGSD